MKKHEKTSINNTIGELQKFPQGLETSFKDIGRIDYDFSKQIGKIW